MNLWGYDADGRTTGSSSVDSTFDAAGQLVQAVGPRRRNNPPLVLMQEFDGDRARVKKTEYGTTTYFLRSTALSGAVVSEIYGTAGQANFGQKQKGHVYANGTELAEQNTLLNAAMYQHHDPGAGEQATSFIHPDASLVGNKTQLDPFGDDVGEEDPYLDQGGGADPPGFSYPHFGDMSDPNSGCTVDGQPWPCTSIGIFLGSSGAAKSVTAGPDAGRLMPRYEWRFNPSQGGEDVCKNGVCPSVVTIDDPGGYFAVAGFDIISSTPMMRGMARQNPAHQIDQRKYDGCAKLLGKSPAPSKLATEAILWTSAQERTDATLIAVTWFEESGFDFRPGPNPRKDGGFDVGPLQTATTVFGKDRFVNSLSDDAGQVMGTFATKGVAFNGDPYLALRWGARALNDGAGIRGRPKDVSARADMAGIYRAGSSRTGSYRTRVNEFNAFQSGYDAFFNCLRK